MQLFYRIAYRNILKVEQFDFDRKNSETSKRQTKIVWPMEIFSIESCSQLKSISSFVQGVWKNSLIQPDGKALNFPYEDDDKIDVTEEIGMIHDNDSKKRRISSKPNNETFISSFSMNDEDCDQKEFKNKHNDMTMIFKLLRQICDFSEFRKL